MLSELTASTRRLALVGLAKNTGKTVALTVLLRELEAASRTVGVTSVGRDGEERDVIDARIEKPRVLLAPGSLVATTDALLRASGVPHELLEDPGIRTPLGRVLIARVSASPSDGANGPAVRAHAAERGRAIEIAGPSAAADVRAVADAMLAHGAEQVLIDGAVDRRAACAPAVSDGLVMATGAVLGEVIEQVVATTSDAVDLVRLPRSEDAGVLLPGQLVLSGEPAEIAAMLAEHPSADTFLVEGALSERFLEGLLGARRERAGRELQIVVGDPTKVFLSRRGPGWYGRQGIAIAVRATIELKAITVNPVAPQSHRFDSERLRELIAAAVPNVPVLDVLDRAYLALAK